MKNVIILGSKGMLGQMVKKYFLSIGYIVTDYNDRFNESTAINYLQKLNDFPDSIIINCIGRIWQKSDKSEDLLLANSILPLALSKSLKNSHILIHPSTDCVFSGLKSTPYKYNDIHDSIDLYGWSKSLGEQALVKRENTLIIRVSIIGFDEYSNKGLLSWFLNNPEGANINGYINHFWNGITTLEWCKQVHKIIISPSFEYFINEKKIIQIGTKKYLSKFELLNIFQLYCRTTFNILPVSMSVEINKCLIPEIEGQEIEIQIAEMIEFWNESVNQR